MDKLYEISEQHKAIALLVENDELSADDVKDTFDALEGEFNAKAVSLVAVVNNMDGDLSAIDDAIKRLQARKSAITNKKESLRDYLKYNMQISGITNIKCPLFSITLAKGRDVVVIDDDRLLPEDLLSVEVVVKPKKADILRRLKGGEDIPGAHIEKTGESLRIK